MIDHEYQLPEIRPIFVRQQQLGRSYCQLPIKATPCINSVHVIFKRNSGASSTPPPGYGSNSIGDGVLQEQGFHVNRRDTFVNLFIIAAIDSRKITH